MTAGRIRGERKDKKRNKEIQENDGGQREERKVK